jgi:hypothetical protein
MANDSTQNLNLNSTKTGARPSHEAVESHNAADGEASEHEHLNQSAMESAKRGQNRIHNDEETTPGNTLFTK